MVAWRVAKSLDQLLAEINAAAPNRSKKSDGSIGDADHQDRTSDHNPWCHGSVVTARDFTHDPAGGFDSRAFADWLRRRCKGEILIDGKRETRVKYVISNRRIASPSSNWEWRAYTGSNPHDKHTHVSVDCTIEGGAMDSVTRWGWPQPTEDDDMAYEQWDRDRLAATFGLAGEIKELVKKPAAVTVAVDAAAVAAALAGNSAFLAALAKAVNDDAAARLAQ